MMRTDTDLGSERKFMKACIWRAGRNPVIAAFATNMASRQGLPTQLTNEHVHVVRHHVVHDQHSAVVARHLVESSQGLPCVALAPMIRIDLDVRER